jgi:hypothetical protein
LRITLAVLLSLAALSGCGGATVERKETTATTGLQLMDLQKAHEMGILTKDEYERERQKVLNP